MRRLSPATLPDVAPTIARFGYDRSRAGIGIVHLGIGAFHRAHQAIYTDEAMATAAELQWAICGVSLRSADIRDRLRPQDGLYTAVEKSAAGTRRRIVGSVREVLFLGDDRAAIAARLAAGETRIVTLTVTEKGYCHDPSSGRLDFAHPDIVHDLATPLAPVTVVGVLVAACAARRASGSGPLTIVCCDNLPHNGRVVQGLVDAFARACDAELARWIAANASFPSTMVDRIVPATATRDIADNDAALNDGAERVAKGGESIHDAAPVVFEPYRQWVIEDAFVTPRPAWDSAGAQLVGDVAPYETMKLRMLNGAHSTMAYLGYLAGREFIHEVAADPRFERIVDGLWDESGATLPPLAGVDVDRYRRDLWLRFGNPALPHRTWQIAMDGSQKLPQRLLAPARERLRAGRAIAHLALGIAGWMRYVSGVGDDGRPIDVRDPLAAVCRARCDANRDADARTRALLDIAPIFGDDLPADARFVEAVAGWHRSLLTVGVDGVLERHFAAT